MDNIERLYKCYEILSEAGDKISEVSGNKEKTRQTERYIHTYMHIHT